MNAILFKVLVSTIAVERRCRAGLCFTKAPSHAEVTETQLAALQSDGYLQVEVLSEANTETANEDQAAVLAEKLTEAGYTQADKHLAVKQCEKLVDFAVSAALRDMAWMLLPEKAIEPPADEPQDEQSPADEDVAKETEGAE